MPKKVSGWACKYCGTSWESEKDAKGCEKLHVGMNCKIEVQVADYRRNQKPPNQLKVKFGSRQKQYCVYVLASNQDAL